MALGLNVALPLGISFYTFQAMSYVIDVYRRDTSATPSVLDFACYVTMFPQLVAGPIVRYTDIAQQLIERRPRLAAGMERFLEGLVKKVLIANTVGEFNDSIWNVIHGGGGIAPSMAFLALVAYTIQIYYDFSGYSDMAIGIGRMLGFEFPENFLHPYSSRSIREFWRRWHISLSTWFRDYLYIPLGGNRKGVPRTFLNNLIVFALCGLWHGAGIMFLLWGLWHGAFLIFERIFLRGKSTKPSSRVVSLLTSLGAHVYALAVIMFGWLLFRSETLADCGLFLRSLFGVVAESQAARGIWLDCSLKFSLAIIFGTIFAFPVWPAFEKLRARHAIFDLLHWILLTVLAIVAIFLLAGGAYNPFLYFRF